MDNQNGYNYSGMVPNNQGNVPLQPNYAVGQNAQPATQSAYNQPTIQAQATYQQANVMPQNYQGMQQPTQPVVNVSATQQMPSVPAQNVGQPVVQATQTATQTQSYPQATVAGPQPQVSYAQQTQPVIQASPSYPQQNTVAQTSYPQVSQVQSQPSMPVPQQVVAQPQVIEQVPSVVTQPVQTQTNLSQTLQVQSSQVPQTSVEQPSISTGSQANSLPVNPIIDLNPQASVTPIEQTINQEQSVQPNPSEGDLNINTFTEQPVEVSTDNTDIDKKKKLNIKIPNLSKKQLIIVGAALGIIILIVIITNVIGGGKSSGNNHGNSNSVVDNSNGGNNVDDSYKDLPIDEWLSYKFEVNGKQASLPISYEQLASLSGFAMKTNYKDQTLDKNNYMSVNLYKNKKLSLFTEIYNQTKGDIKLPKGNVTRISQTQEQVKKGADPVLFPANLKVGMEMTEDNLVSLLGSPSTVKNYSSNDYVNNSYIYYEGERTSVNYYEVKIVNDVIDQITIDHRG